MFRLKLITSFVLALAVTGMSIPVPREENLSSECGKTYAEFTRPWRVELRSFSIFFSKPLECGGVLVSDRFVLTAAHCLDGLGWFPMKIRIGDHGFELLEEKYPYQEYGIRRKIVHEHFEEVAESRYVNDIALIELSSPVRFREHMAPACLPRDVGKLDGENATVSEMGPFDLTKGSESFTQRKLEVQILPSNFCTILWGYPRFESPIPHETMCGKSQEPKCRERQTLAGLPLILEEDGYAHAIGIASWSTPCDLSGGAHTQGALTVFTNVSSHMDWIRHNMKPNREDEGDAWKTIRAVPYHLIPYIVIFLLCGAILACLTSTTESRKSG